MPLNNGEVFAGYVIQRLLGTGGMGEVYLAQHPRLPRQDALKILSSASTADEEFRARFIREAELAATLWHPHIVGVLDRGEFNGRLWISMDYVDGTDAGRLIRERYPGGMPEQDVSEIVTAVADALDFGHDRRLLHRDVKPENILVTASDGHRRRVLLTDFGIARRIDDVSNLTDDNVAVGTISYIAPEQLLGKPLDGRADQYALAATTFHLLTGAPTFSRLESRCRHQPPSRYATTADIGAPTRSRAPRRRAGKGAGQRPQRAIPELPRLCPSPHAAGSSRDAAPPHPQSGSQTSGSGPAEDLGSGERPPTQRLERVVVHGTARGVQQSAVGARYQVGILSFQVVPYDPTRQPACSCSGRDTNSSRSGSARRRGRGRGQRRLGRRHPRRRQIVNFSAGARPKRRRSPGPPQIRRETRHRKAEGSGSLHSSPSSV